MLVALLLGGLAAQVHVPPDRGIALLRAAEDGDAAAVERLLAAGAEPNARDGSGNTPLLLGALRHPQVVRLLLRAGADVDLANDAGETPLMRAAQGDLLSVRLLVDAGADVSRRDELGVSALAVAKEAGKREIVALLRARGATESLEERLDLAIRDGDLDAVERLIAAGADVDALDTASYQTPLMTAVELGRPEILLRLLEAGADPLREGTGISTTGENAIRFAARQGSPWALRRLLDVTGRQSDRDDALLLGCANEAVVRAALEMGASPQARNARGETALDCALAAGASDAVATLLEAGARRAEREPRRASPPAPEPPSPADLRADRDEALVQAVREGDLASVERLVGGGADVDAIDPTTGRTLLMTALDHGRLEILLRLVEAGADPTRAGGGSPEDNAIQLAARLGSPWALRLLLEAKARPRDRNDALLLGCANESIVRVALDEGADPNATNARGETALDCAREAGSTGAVAALLQAGAREMRPAPAPSPAAAPPPARAAAPAPAPEVRESLEEDLGRAIRGGDLRTVERLIAAGADVDAPDGSSPHTPLMTALQFGRLEILLRLVGAGADPTREAAEGDNAIRLAARLGSPWALRQLLEAGSRPRDRDEALLLGCANEAVVRVALEHGANPNARSSADETALGCAAAAGNAGAVSELLDAGSDPNALSRGRTALGWAIANQHADVVRLLQRAASSR